MDFNPGVGSFHKNGPLSSLECRTVTVSSRDNSFHLGWFRDFFGINKTTTIDVCQDAESTASLCSDPESSSTICLSPKDTFTMEAVERSVKNGSQNFCQDGVCRMLAVSSLDNTSFYRVSGPIITIEDGKFAFHAPMTATASTREGAVATWCNSVKNALSTMTFSEDEVLFFPYDEVCPGSSVFKTIQGEVDCHYGDCRDSQGNKVEGKTITIGCAVTTID